MRSARLTVALLLASTSYVGTFCWIPAPGLALRSAQQAPLCSTLPREPYGLRANAELSEPGDSSGVPSPLREAASTYKKISVGRGGDIPAELFLVACKHTTSVIGRLGAVFSPVRADIDANINTLLMLAQHQESTSSSKRPGSPVTLQELLREEKPPGTSAVTADDALRWLTRAMQFIAEFLGRVSAGEEAGAAAQAAYTGTLRRWHGFAARHAFSAALLAAPNTDMLLARLAGGAGKAGAEAEARAALAEWVAAAAPVIAALDG